jgi:ABC-type amino acid transport substrate-binding protein
MAAAFGRQLKRPVKLMPLPRKRMMGALESAEGDIVCGYSPAWFKGDVDWTRPFIPTSEVLIASRRVPAPTALDDIRGKTVGTVLGFNYPEVQRRLGAGFVRDDAPSLELTLRKWQGGRFDYFLATGVTVERQFASGELAAGFNQLVISEEKTGCAIARRGTLSVAEVNAAIDAIEKSGELARLLLLR